MENISLRKQEIKNCEYLRKSQEHILLTNYIFIQQLAIELNKENLKLNFVNIIASVDTQHRLKKISDRVYYLTLNRLYKSCLELISDDGYNKTMELYNILLKNTKEN